MGLADKLAGKTKGLGDASVSTVATEAPPVAPRAPRTGPGQMLAVRGMMQEDKAEIERLRQQLDAHAGSEPAKALDARTVGVSKFANRHDDEFQTREYRLLRAEIEKAGRNVQPIRVREVSGRGEIRYEVVYGHRRLRACQDLKLPVWAIVGSCTDEELFQFMDMENRQRKNPSPFELGDSYRRALEAGLFSSLRQLAAKVQVDHSLAAKAYGIATLPPEVLAAFPSPTQIQYRWGAQLSEALQKDPEGVIRRAKSLSPEVRASAPAVLAALLAVAPATGKRQLRVGPEARVVGSMDRNRRGAVAINIDPGIVTAERMGDLEALLTKFLDSNRAA